MSLVKFICEMQAFSSSALSLDSTILFQSVCDGFMRLCGIKIKSGCESGDSREILVG